MKLSAKSRYALEALVYMAIAFQDEPMSIRQISENTGISEKYLEQIFFLLRKGGVLEASRGTKGGFMIAGGPDGVTVGKVIRAMEGEVVPVACVNDLSTCKSRAKENCVTRWLWLRISSQIDRTIDGITVGQLKEKYIKRQETR